jgi:Histidinol dehydrogenase
MKTYENLAQSDWEQALARPRFEPKQLISKVETILQTVQEKGDQALLDYTKTFDKVALSELVVEVATEKPIIRKLCR